MQRSANDLFQILGNNFNNRNSEFSFQNHFKTDTHTIPPYYPKISITKNTDGTITLGVKTKEAISYVLFEKNEYKSYKRMQVIDTISGKATPKTFNFVRDVYNPYGPPYSLFGFESGLVACIDHRSKEVINRYNEDGKKSIRLLAVLPLFFTEFIVLFEDSTAMRYKLKEKSYSAQFMKKVRKFGKKMSFDLQESKLKSKSKKKNKHFWFSCYLNDAKKEFNYFSAINNHPKEQNPTAYYKFNHRDISDLVVRSHPSFRKTVLRYSTDNQDNMILALTSRDGYLVLYELNTMKPLLSYKTPNGGGLNALCFSENCELIALSGPDENITVLDLYTLNIVRCVEGHKALVSRAIFHTIHVSTGRQDQDQENEREVGVIDTSDKMRQSSWMRIIGGGMDGLLSFWEFRTDILGLRGAEIEESQLPLRLDAESIIKSDVVKPVHLEPLSDAIGWVEIFDNMLFVCKYDGKIDHFQIRSLNLL